jgi:tetratricopeptide (TPR) repeat protein
MYDPFTEFLRRPSQEGIALFEREYGRTGALGQLFNLGLALLDVGDWHRAKDTYGKIINESDYTIDAHFIMRGMADWFLGNTSSAIESWKQAVDAGYTDAAGPIDGPLILWYAGRRLGDEKLVKGSLKKLRRFWKVKDYRVIDEWPDSPAIAGFLLEKVPKNVFLNEWKWPAGSAEYRRLCRAQFWVGMKGLDRSEDEAIKHFKTAFSTNKIAIGEYEYFLAKWEYARLTNVNLWDQQMP